ncbi:hypothetical protein ACJX0J_022017, partial [Zea mays]
RKTRGGDGPRCTFLVTVHGSNLLTNSPIFSLKTIFLKRLISRARADGATIDDFSLLDLTEQTIKLESFGKIDVEFTAF